MKLSLPDELDETVLGISVTFWSDATHKWLLQYSSKVARPCFAQIDGVRQKITVAFDPSMLYRKCVACVLLNPLPESALSEWPSLLVGLTFETLNIHANVRANEEGMKCFATSELVEYLTAVIAAAPELDS